MYTKTKTPNGTLSTSPKKQFNKSRSLFCVNDYRGLSYFSICDVSMS